MSSSRHLKQQDGVEASELEESHSQNLNPVVFTASDVGLRGRLIRLIHAR
jgi:hypothetical protein